MNEIVVLTASYNRADNLQKLYSSLKAQTNKKFEWLIVDDGSTDDTENLISHFIEENQINIKYIYQSNGGKAKALNKGFCQSDYAEIFAVVDSDDYLLPNAIDLIYDNLNRYKNHIDVGAFFFHYKRPDGQTIESRKKKLDEDKILTVYEYNNIFGKHDGCICYFRDAVYEYRYPEYTGEKYVGPTVILMEMSEKYKIVYSPTILGIAEYQEGGLTKSGRKLRLKNPRGMIHYCTLMMSNKSNLITQFKYGVSIWPYSRLAKKSFREILSFVKKPLLLLVTYIPGQLLYFYWKKYM